jgi:curved DNA-binding protein CbpA
MADPYAVFGLTPEADDETIRRRYLELVKQNPPEQRPEQFAAVRAAYDKLRDLDTRLQQRLLETGKDESIESIIEEVLCRSPRPRLTLEALRAARRTR